MCSATGNLNRNLSQRLRTSSASKVAQCIIGDAGGATQLPQEVTSSVPTAKLQGYNGAKVTRCCKQSNLLTREYLGSTSTLMKTFKLQAALRKSFVVKKWAWWSRMSCAASASRSDHPVSHRPDFRKVEADRDAVPAGLAFQLQPSAANHSTCSLIGKSIMTSLRAECSTSYRPIMFRKPRYSRMCRIVISLAGECVKSHLMLTSRSSKRNVELRRFAATQEQNNPVSFALDNSLTATLKSDKLHFLEHTTQRMT